MVEKSKRYLGLVPAKRRALWVLLFALVYITYGVGLGFSPAPNTPGPNWFPSVMFAGAGLITLVAALRDRPRFEWVGFTTLQVVSVLWALQFLWLAATGSGFRPWSGLLIWTWVTLLITLQSGWAEPPPRHVLMAVQAFLAQQEAEREQAQARHRRDPSREGD